MESYECMNAVNELVERKFKTEQELNNLKNIRLKVKAAESEMQYETAEDMRSLSRIEELFDGSDINIGEAVVQIRQQLKGYDESARTYGEGQLVVFDKKIEKIEDKLKSIGREEL